MKNTSIYMFCICTDKHLNMKNKQLLHHIKFKENENESTYFIYFNNNKEYCTFFHKNIFNQYHRC